MVNPCGLLCWAMIHSIIAGMTHDEATGLPLVTLKGIQRTEQHRVLLADVSLSIGAREIVTIVGPNGAGKTTLLRALLKLDEVQAGTVWHQPGLSIGYMPQRLPVSDLLPLTVHRFLQLHRSGGRKSIIEALTSTEVAHLIDAPLSALSGGELQRVLLARALLNKPQLLVLDEPVQGVDFQGEAALYQLIHSLTERLGCSVLMVSHDLHVVMAATDQVICLNQHVCCAGTPETVEANPAFLNLFGRHAAQTLGVYQHHHNHDHSLHEQGGSVVRD